MFANGWYKSSSEFIAIPLMISNLLNKKIAVEFAPEPLLLLYFVVSSFISVLSTKFQQLAFLNHLRLKDLHQ